MILLRLLSWLPFSVLYAFSDFLFFVGYYVLGYRRAMVRKNLRNSFPDKSDKELKQIGKDFYHNLCDYAVETIKLLTLSGEELKRRMVYKNPEIVNQFSDKNQSILLLTSHQFNWEWLLTSGCLYLPLGVDFVYQRQSNKTFDDFSLMGRTRFGAYPVERSQVAREAIKRKHVLRGIAIMADQFPGHHNTKKYWTEFLNQRTAFYLGLGQLASLTQYPAVFYGVKKIKRGYYEAEGFVVSHLPYEKESQQIVEDYIVATESIIKQQPAGWLWSHNRWKAIEESD
ncbi:MAG: lysophospholipid acyltransferase family protein [Cyclobacteriaceae bacterium]|nr:lysophospholipid acyltransferase family protein [Cyclobacteriaceae bacterium]